MVWLQEQARRTRYLLIIRGILLYQKSEIVILRLFTKDVKVKFLFLQAEVLAKTEVWLLMRSK
jgi:hypothetical protein